MIETILFPKEKLLVDTGLRNAIVDEARTWIRTPYVKRGRIKGAGTDCGMLPYMVLRKFDLVPDLGEDVPTLEDGWFCHTTDQRYARLVERYFRRLLTSQCRHEGGVQYLPGNLALVRTRNSRVFNHAGIITKWSRVVHATPDCGVVEVDASTDQYWAYHEIAVYDIGV